MGPPHGSAQHPPVTAPSPPRGPQPGPRAPSRSSTRVSPVQPALKQVSTRAYRDEPTQPMLRETKPPKHLLQIPFDTLKQHAESRRTLKKLHNKPHSITPTPTRPRMPPKHRHTTRTTRVAARSQVPLQHIATGQGCVLRVHPCLPVWAPLLPPCRGEWRRRRGEQPSLRHGRVPDAPFRGYLSPRA